MSRIQVSTFSGCNVYNLSAGKAVPQWLNEKHKRQVSKEDDYRRRVELIQDLEFPTASQRIRVSPDGQYIVASGTYPPAVRVYEVQEMSMKFERRLTAEVVDFLILSEDVGKLVFLQNDRTVAFHAPYGAHYATRIPTFGRTLAYHPPSCDLYIAAVGSEIYRLNLEEGRFRAPLLSRSSEGVNVLGLNPMHMLMAAGGEDGTVEFFDPRSRDSLTHLDMTTALVGQVREPVAVSALEFDRDGLTFCVGTSSGHCLLYDLRSSRALVCKEHQYNLPIVSLRFHQAARKVLSADAKILKIWERDGNGGGGDGGGGEGGEEGDDIDISLGGGGGGGKGRGAVLTNIETPAAINDVCVVPDVSSHKDSGLLLLAGEQERVMTYYVPALGPAPRWCSFLDSITEELEEGDSALGGGGADGSGGTGAASTVYDDYKFVTRQEVEELNAGNLIGTPLLRGYMHGFFMDASLYAKLQAVAQPAAYEEYHKKRLKERLEAKRASRISFQKKLPSVNRALAERLLQQKMGGRREEEEEEEEEGEGEGQGQGKKKKGGAADNPLGDSRFASLFTRDDFEVDEESEAFKLRNPNGISEFPGGRKARARRRREGSDEEGSDDDLAAVVQNSFREVEGYGGGREEEGEEGGEESDDNEVDYRAESLGGKKNLAIQQKSRAKTISSTTSSSKKQTRRPRFMEAEAVGEDGRAMLLHDHERRAGAKGQIEAKRLPLLERLKKKKAGGGEESASKKGSGSGKLSTTNKRGKLVKLSAQEGGGFVREATYMPAERRKSGASDGGGKKKGGAKRK